VRKTPRVGARALQVLRVGSEGSVCIILSACKEDVQGGDLGGTVLLAGTGSIISGESDRARVFRSKYDCRFVLFPVVRFPRLINVERAVVMLAVPPAASLPLWSMMNYRIS